MRKPLEHICILVLGQGLQILCMLEFAVQFFHTRKLLINKSYEVPSALQDVQTWLINKSYEVPSALQDVQTWLINKSYAIARALQVVQTWFITHSQGALERYLCR
jgi:ABC-type metal ion transport system substrate-binding protein